MCLNADGQTMNLLKSILFALLCIWYVPDNLSELIKKGA